MLKATGKKKEGNERISEIEFEIKKIDFQIDGLRTKREDLVRERINIELSPFKVGDYVLAEVSSGRTKKEQKCLIECCDGIVYVRPVNDKGELSGRHFSILPFNGKTYKDYFKKC